MFRNCHEENLHIKFDRLDLHYKISSIGLWGNAIKWKTLLALPQEYIRALGLRKPMKYASTCVSQHTQVE